MAEIPIVREKLREHNHPDWIEGAEYIAELFDKHIDKKSSILQLGCACGYVLDGLWETGFKNLTGFDRNKDSLKEITNPKIKKICGELSEEIDKIKPYDVILCSRFLYVQPSEQLFKKIAEKAKKYLVAVEREEETTEYKVPHFNRNYKEVFEPLGLKQIFSETNIFSFQFGELTTTTTRIFEPCKE